jgi:hypothetical protein
LFWQLTKFLKGPHLPIYPCINNVTEARWGWVHPAIIPWMWDDMDLIEQFDCAIW